MTFDELCDKRDEPSGPKWIPTQARLPESGKPVLVVSEGKVIRAAYIAPMTIDEESWGAWNEGEGGSDYDEETDTYYWPECWCEWNQYEETHWQLEKEPMFWMPLPEIPK